MISDIATIGVGEPSPHNIEAEQALLGALFNNNQVASVVAALVIPEDFFDGLHAEIWEVSTRLIAEGRAVTPVTLKAYFEGHPPVGTGYSVPQYLGTLSAEATTVCNARDYARTVAEFGSRRRLLAIAETQRALAQDGRLAPDAIIAETIVGLDAEVSRVSGGRRAISDFEDAFTARMAELQNCNATAAISTGWRALDEKIGGWRRGQFSIIAGRPSMGKSAVAIATGLNAAQSGASVLFITLEMKRGEIIDRLLADLSFDNFGVNNVAYARTQDPSSLTADEIERLARTGIDAGALPFSICEAHGETALQIIGRVRSHKQRLARDGRKLDVVVIDHLGHIAASARYAGNMNNETSEKSRAMQVLAATEDVAVIAACQLNRAAETRDNKRPQLSDLRDSGSIEQDADRVIAVFREAYYLEKGSGLSPELENDRRARLATVQNELNLVILKNRHGATGTVTLFFDPRYNAVREV